MCLNVPRCEQHAATQHQVSTQQSTHLIVPVSLSFFEIMTVQAPHPPSAHPNLLPGSLITSLKNERSV
jgi:hypothetical protein